MRLGGILQSLGRPREAIITLQRAPEAAAPDAPEARVALAVSLRQIGELQLARNELEYAVNGGTNDSRAWFKLGLAFEDLRDTPAAIRAYRHAVEAQPDFPEAHVNLGINLQNVGEFDAAMESYRCAMRIRPNTFGRIAQALTASAKG